MRYAAGKRRFIPNLITIHNFVLVMSLEAFHWKPGVSDVSYIYSLTVQLLLGVEGMPGPA
jgi:hypothetical protein